MHLERRRDLAHGRQGRFQAAYRLGHDLPAQAKSDKSQGVRGTESPASINQTLKKTEKHVSVFSGEVQCGAGYKSMPPIALDLCNCDIAHRSTKRLQGTFFCAEAHAHRLF